MINTTELAQLNAEQLADLLLKEDITEEDKEIISQEIVKNIGIKVAALTLLTTTRYLKMENILKAIIEEDGELYKLELKKISDVTPEKGERQHDKDISQSISVTVEVFK